MHFQQHAGVQDKQGRAVGEVLHAGLQVQAVERAHDLQARRVLGGVRIICESWRANKCVRR